MVDRFIFGSLAFLLAFVGISGAADAGKPSAIVVGCDRAQSLKRAVTRALDTEFMLASVNALKTATRRSGIDLSTPNGALDLVRELGVDLFVRCTPGYGQKQATIDFVSANGNLLCRQTVKSSKKRLQSRSFAVMIKKGSQRAIDGLNADGQTALAQAEDSALDQRVANVIAASDAAHVVEETPAIEQAPQVIEHAPAPTLAASTLPTQSDLKRQNEASAVVLVGGSLRSSTLRSGIETEGQSGPRIPGVDVVVHARPFGNMGLLVDLETGATLPQAPDASTQRDAQFRFSFATSYLFDLSKIGIGPSIAVGVDPMAPGAPLGRGSHRIARAGALLLVPIHDALQLRLEGAYRPVFGAEVSKLVGSGFVVGGSVEGTIGGGFSYALRTDYQRIEGREISFDETALAFSALLGWRL